MLISVNSQPDLHPSASALERRITVVAVVLPFAGFLAALWLLWGGAVTARDLLILAVAYVLVGLGVTVGFHRMLTHRSFEAKPWLRATLAILGSMSVQGAVIHWVADHRRHHTFTDEEGDPHSPHTHSGEGWRGVFTGLWHSHMGWLFEDQHSSARRYAPDLRKDPVIRRVDKLFPLWVAARARDPLPRRARAVGRVGARRPDRLRLGGVGARVLAPSRHLERELDLPHVRPPALRYLGREPRQLARRARIARRRLAPQPPRLPDLGAPRPAAHPDRPVLRRHPHPRAPRARLERQAAAPRADRGQATRPGHDAACRRRPPRRLSSRGGMSPEGSRMRFNVRLRTPLRDLGGWESAPQIGVAIIGAHVERARDRWVVGSRTSCLGGRTAGNPSW